MLEELLDEAGVKRRSVLIRGRTRISLNVQDASTGLEYRFVPEGPTLTGPSSRPAWRQSSRSQGSG